MFGTLRRRSARMQAIFSKFTGGRARPTFRACVRRSFDAIYTASSPKQTNTQISKKAWKVRPEVLWQHLPRDTEESMKKRERIAQLLACSHPLAHVFPVASVVMLEPVLYLPCPAFLSTTIQTALHVVDRSIVSIELGSLELGQGVG